MVWTLSSLPEDAFRAPDLGLFDRRRRVGCRRLAVRGAQIPLLFDRVATVRFASLPVTPVAYDGGGFRVGGIPMTFVGTDNQRSAVTLRIDSQNRVVLENGGQAFTLGPLTRPPDPAGRPAPHVRQ